MIPEGPHPSPSSRRVFLSTAAAGAAGVVASQVSASAGEALPATSTPTLISTRKAIALGAVTASDFSPHVGSLFDVDAGPHNRLALELSEAVALPGGGGAPSRSEPFSLIFRGPASPVLDQGIQTLSHPELGELTLFLVPVGPGRAGKLPRYEAVFN